MEITIRLATAGASCPICNGRPWNNWKKTTPKGVVMGCGHSMDEIAAALDISRDELENFPYP